MSLLKHKYPAVYKNNCPSCNKKIKYYRLGGMGQAFPYFYCDKCSNVYHSNEDKKLVMENELSEELLNKIVASLPDCPCGGHFCIDKGPKCPYCDYRETRGGDFTTKLTEPHAIIIKGYALYSKKNSSSYLLPWLGQKLIGWVQNIRKR